MRLFPTRMALGSVALLTAWQWEDPVKDETSSSPRRRPKRTEAELDPVQLGLDRK
jgi:hypothetical protein